MQGKRRAGPIGVVLSDTGGRIHQANDAFLEMIGRDRAALALGEVRWDELTPVKWLPHDAAAVAEAAARGRCAPYEKELRHADASLVPVLVAITLVDRETGQTTMYVLDLSEQRQADAQLTRMNEQMRLAIGAARMFFWDWDLVTDRVEWSGGLEAACGLPPGGFGGTAAAFRALIDPADLPQVEAAIGEALAGRGAAYEAEFRMVWPDGTRRWVLSRGTVLRDASDRPVRLLGIDLDMTDRKATERALAESEALRRTMLSRLREGVALCEMIRDDSGRGVDFRYLEVGGGWEEMTGIAPAAAAGARVTDLIPGIETAWIDTYDQVVRTGEDQHFVMEVGPLGRLFDCHAFAMGGLRFGVSFVDVTERRRAERALADSEMRYRRLADALPALIFVTDAEGRYVFTNKSYQHYAGRPAKALLGNGWADLMHPDDRGRVEAEWRRSVTAGAPCDIELRLRRDDGASRTFLVRSAPERDKQGRILRWIGTCTDVDDWRRSEVARGAAEDQLRLAVEAAELGAWSWDLRTGELEVTARCNELYGLARDSRPDWDTLARVLHPDDVAGRDMVIADALSRRGGYEVEYRVRLPGGEAWRRSVGRTETGPDGSVRVLRGVVFDIDRQKRAEDALRDDRDRLEARVAERTRALSSAAAELAVQMRQREEMQSALLQSHKLEAMGQLTGGVAHDFNNILAAIQGSYRLLERQVGGNARAADLVRRGLEAAERGARIIGQLMSFARREELRPRPLHLGAVLRNAETLIVQTAGNGIDCRFEIEAELWSVIVDQTRLEMTLMNLAANARDAMPDGGVLTIAARRAVAGDLPDGISLSRDHVVVSVADTGSGMDEATQRRATEPFFTTKSVGKGTGLGLASAHGFAEQSGGALRLRSAPGQGTVVELLLPRAAVDASGATEGATEGADSQPDDEIALAPPGEDVLILLVDDDDAVRPFTAGLLRELGYRVIEAASAETAEALAPGGQGIDMLVTDIIMPGAPGHVLAARLRQERADLPVLFITGYGGDAVLGDAPVLLKPFTEMALARAVRHGLRRAARSRAAHAQGGNVQGGDDQGGAAAGTSATGEFGGLALRPVPAALPDRLIGRLRHPLLRETYLRWLARRDLAGGAPNPALMAGTGLPEPVVASAFLVEVVGHGAFRYLQVGEALTARLGRSLVGETLRDDEATAGADAVANEMAVAAYRKCLVSQVAHYDYTSTSRLKYRPQVLDHCLSGLPS